MNTKYDNMQFNGLAEPSEIIAEQLQRLGIETADFDSGATIGTPGPPGLSPPTGDTSTIPTSVTQPLVYDGPADTKKTVGEMLQEYGIPTSAAALLSSAESAVIDIPRDLHEAKEDVWTILTKGDRLQGMGALLIVVAAIMALINLLR